MDALHINGVLFEVWLQTKLAGAAEYFSDVTKVGDPDLLMLYLFPFVCAINRSLFLRFVMTAALCDFLNNVFKWALHGHRPYWWIVEESSKFEAPPQLKQFSVSCETGPGSPSGHAMITASIWFIIVYAYVRFIAKNSKAHKLCAWIFYVLLFCLVSVSRLYIGTHFPHQVLLVQYHICELLIVIWIIYSI